MIQFFAALAIVFIGNILISSALLWVLRRLRISINAKIACVIIGRLLLLAILLWAITDPFDHTIAGNCLILCAGGFVFQFTSRTLFLRGVQKVEDGAELICNDYLFRRKVLRVADTEVLAALTKDSSSVNVLFGKAEVKVIRLGRLRATAKSSSLTNPQFLQ